MSSERGTPFAGYLGEVILAVDQRFDARTGRVGLKICFATGSVQCDSWGGGPATGRLTASEMILYVTGVITASEPSWTAPFTGLSPRAFGKLVTQLRREGAIRAAGVDLGSSGWRTGYCWSPRTGGRTCPPRRPVTLSGVSKSAADRIIDHLGPSLALQPRKRLRKDTVLIVDGTLVPTCDHTIAEQPKGYRYCTNHQVVIDADTQLVVVVGRPLPGNRNDCKAWELSGAKDAVGKMAVIADGGCRAAGLLIPHRREPGQYAIGDELILLDFPILFLSVDFSCLQVVPYNGNSEICRGELAGRDFHALTTRHVGYKLYARITSNKFIKCVVSNSRRNGVPTLRHIHIECRIFRFSDDH